MGFGTFKFGPFLGYNVFKGKFVATVGPIEVPLSSDKKTAAPTGPAAEVKPEIPAEPEQRLDPTPPQDNNAAVLILLLLAMVVGMCFALWTNNG